MSFFETTDTKGTGNFELGGGEIALIPNDTKVLAVCEDAKNDMYNLEETIKLKWRVSQPAEYANRVLFQKLKVYDPAKGAQHKRMLAAIATNAGGKLFAAMEKAGESTPSDASLATITNQPMVLQLGTWELDDKSKKGNWVKAVSPRKPLASAPVKAAPTPAIDTDDVPF